VAMALKGKTKLDLDKKYKKVLKTPASFDFFVAIHDFIEQIESDSSLVKILLSKAGANVELKIPAKYDYLKIIHQGLKDAKNKSDADLGHARYAALLELNKIKDNDVSDSNSFWKKREVMRKFVSDIYGRLVPTSV